jgi:holo-[acyl-carrier protein] synthase
VEVVRGGTGAPQLRATGRAASLALSLGVTAWHVSLTHTALVAGAVVLAQ